MTDSIPIRHEITLELFQSIDYDIETNTTRFISELRFVNGDAISYQVERFNDFSLSLIDKELVFPNHRKRIMRRLSGEEAREEIAKLQKRIDKLEAKK